MQEKDLPLRIRREMTGENSKEVKTGEEKGALASGAPV